MFRRKTYVLGKEHSMDILEHLFKNDWCKASDVAKEKDLHVATAGTYLEELHEIGVLDRREGQGETRKVLEYRLKDPKIEVSFDLSDMFGQKDEEGSDAELHMNFLESLIDETKTIYGFIPEEVKGDLDVSEDDEDHIVDAIRRLLRYNEERAGLIPTQRLVRRVIVDIEDRSPMNKDYKQLMDRLPRRYFESLKEEFDETD